MKLRTVLVVASALAVAAGACGEGDTTTGSGGEVRTVLTDYQHDEFASAFLRYYPEKVTVRPGDTVRFKQTWTGEPHSVTMGKVVDKMFENQELLEKYDSEEEAAAAGVTQEKIQEVLESFTKIPGMLGGDDDAVYQPGAQPCAILDEADVPMFSTIEEEINPDAECPTKGKPLGAFRGHAFYNSGFIPYEGEGGNVFDVPLADDVEPGTYNYFCNYHWISMSGQIEVVDKDADIPSQSQVTSQARREIQADAKGPLQRVREARKTKGGAKIGDLEAPLAGRQADDEFAVYINEFLPKNGSAQVGEPVTWTFDGAPHTVSFKVPKYFPLFEIRKDGTVYRNPDAYQPVGFDVPEREGDPFAEGEEGSIEVDGGRWDGRGGFRSSGILFPGDKFTITFTRAGTYPYACVLHPQMVGTVEVNE